MNDDAEVIRLEVDPEDAVRGAAAGNAAMDAYSKKAEAAVRAASKAFDDHGSVVVRVSDRSRGSIERLVSALEKQAATYGKTGVDRLIAERDRMIQRLGNEEAAVKRVTAAYERMIEAEKGLAASTAASGGSTNSGFRTTFAIKGIKDVAEGRGTFALAEAVNELMVLRGTALLVGGMTAGIAAIGFAAYESRKKMEELAEMPEKLRGAFGRFVDEGKLANDEMRLTNDRLESAIAKLEHRPANGLKLAIDEAAVAADKLAASLDKSITGFSELMQKNAIGGLERFFAFFHGGVQGSTDIKELLEGKTGFGGFRGAVYDVVRQGGNPTGVLSDYRGRVQKLLDISENAYNAQHGKPYRTDLGPIETTANQEPRMEVLRALLQQIDTMSTAYGLEQRNAALTGRKSSLETVAGYEERAREIERKSREALDAAYLGSQTPMEKYFGELAKIGSERADNLRTLPGQSGIVDAAAFRNSTAARLRLLEELRQRTERTDTELESSENFGKGAADDLAHALLKRLFTETEKSLRNAGVIDERGGLNQSIIGTPTAPIPEGYVSPQQQLQNIRRGEQRYLGLYGIRAGLAGMRPQQQIEGVYSARLGFAEQEYQAQLKIADAITETQKREDARIAALNEREEKRFEAQMEREQKLLEIDKQHFDEIKQASASLYHTLFTNPRAFGGQLLGTVREAALRPVIDRMSTMTAQFLTPFFSQNGGISDVKLVGGAVPVHIVNAGPVASGGGGFFGGGPISASSTSLYDMPMAGTPSAMAYAAGSPLAAVSNIVGGPGGTSGFAGRVGGFGGIFGNGGLASLFRGGWSGLRSRLGGFTRGDASYIDNGDGTVTPGAPGNGLGAIKGVNGFAGAALMAGGGMLAQYGLLGDARGTGAGVAFGAAGGAMAGFALGGPIGAGIGAGVGAGIGIGEVIAGVQTKRREAHLLIQSIYGVNIPEPSGVMQQIVAAAEQYGGSVGMAVRTQQVRQLIELYAMSTGQRNNLFLETPHAASLVQTNGRLYQGLSYFNGSGYNYASSLPTLGYSAGTIPTGNPFSGGPVLFQLAINGQSASDALGGQVVRVANPGYVSNQNYAALQSGDRYRQAAALYSPQSIFA